MCDTSCAQAWRLLPRAAIPTLQSCPCERPFHNSGDVLRSSLAPSPLDEERCEKKWSFLIGLPTLRREPHSTVPKNVPATFTNGLKSPRPKPAYIVSVTFSDAAYFEEDEKMCPTGARFHYLLWPSVASAIAQ